ncbi:MAG: hypothetical protein AB1609_14150 [Bacillota bacterium]
MPQRRFRWTGAEQKAEVRALFMRALNPLRHSPRRKPRDPEALESLARLTLRLVREDRRFERIGPRWWRLVADDTGAVRPLC